VLKVCNPHLFILSSTVLINILSDQVALLAWYAIHQLATVSLPTYTYQSDPRMIKEIVDAVTIPVMAKVRIGHFVEAQVKNYCGRIPK
jgi:hypothetical protein